MNWPTVKLSTIATIERDQIDPSNIHSGTSYLGLEDIESGGRIIEAHKVDRGDLASAKFRFTRDHILYGKLRPYLAKISLPDFEGICSTDILPLRPKSNIDRRYLAYFLRRPESIELATLRTTGANLPRLSPKALADFDIPCPPIGQQRRIAAILDKADTIRRKREQTLDLADDFLKSAFLEMFGDPALNRKGLSRTPLGEIIRVSSGDGLIAKNMAPGGIYPVYGGNGINGYHSEFMFEEPQIVIGRVGVYCGAVHISEPKSWITDNALYIREYRKPINKTYLEWALRFANLNQYAGRAAQPLISGGRIYEVEILEPEEPQQMTFERLVKDHKALVSKISVDRDLSTHLFSALSQRAFCGEL
jgi:type I restriction enzyme S subunit